jgi:hypothetical protein
MNKKGTKSNALKLVPGSSPSPHLRRLLSVFLYTKTTVTYLPRRIWPATMGKLKVWVEERRQRPEVWVE